jgi:hypothetical protein
MTPVRGSKPAPSGALVTPTEGPGCDGLAVTGALVAPPACGIGGGTPSGLPGARALEPAAEAWPPGRGAEAWPPGCGAGGGGAIFAPALGGGGMTAGGGDRFVVSAVSATGDTWEGASGAIVKDALS